MMKKTISKFELAPLKLLNNFENPSSNLLERPSGRDLAELGMRSIQVVRESEWMNQVYYQEGSIAPPPTPIPEAAAKAGGDRHGPSLPTGIGELCGKPY